MRWSDGTDRKQEGRSFHHGLFIQNLRRKAQSAKGVALVEATVNELLEDEAGTIVGVKATPRKASADDDASEPLHYRAKLTIVADGCMSKFRRALLPSHIVPTTRSHFVGLVLEDADLPAPHHGHVILGKADPANPPAPVAEGVPSLGPVLVYQLATHDTRMLVDVRGPKLPPQAQLAAWLREHVTPVLPPTVVASFHAALDKSLTKDKQHRLRSMPNSYLPPYPQGRDTQGAFLAGDSLNMRHPLTGGGMTVAFNDCVLLTELLGGGKAVSDVQGDERGPVELDNWLDVSERLEEWHWKRKAVASCINVLSLALYSLFGADGASSLLSLGVSLPLRTSLTHRSRRREPRGAQDGLLQVLRARRRLYPGPGRPPLGVRPSSSPPRPRRALADLPSRRLHPSPARLFYHFFRVAFYSIYCLFTLPILAAGPDGGKPGLKQYPALTVKSFKVFWTACVVLLPVLWSEGQM